MAKKKLTARKTTGGEVSRSQAPSKKAKGGSVVKCAISVDDEGEWGSAILDISGKITCDGADAGTISAVLVDRSQMRRGDFHGLCDEHSQGLQGISCAMFGSSGQTRLGSMRDDPSCSRDGFLYIADLTIHAKHRRDGGSDVGTAALREFFDAIRASHSFTVVAYECCTYSNANVPGAAADEEGTVTKKEDARPFLRVGFKEEVELSRKSCSGAITLYATAEDHPGHDVYLTHQEACDYDFWAPANAPPPPPTGKDQELMQLFRDHTGARTTAFEKSVRTLVSAGASVRGSFAMHFCAAQGQEMAAMATLVDLLVALDPSCVNGRDASNLTPLMIAVQAAHGQTTKHAPAPKDTLVRKLLACGADRALTDNGGHSALGRLRLAARSSEDMLSALCSEPRPTAHQRAARYGAMEALLVPPGGATAADRAVFNAAAPAYDEDGDSFDEEEDEEDRAYGACTGLTPHGILARLPAYNARHGCSFSGKPVESSHRKNCTECDHRFDSMGFGSEWYWTDFASPWGAEKYCSDCMAQKVGGYFEESGGGFGSEDEDDEDDY